MEELIKLDIGAGKVVTAGHKPIGRDYGSEAYPLVGYADESVDAIRASHILEHFDHTEAPKALMDWVRVLKPGGSIRISVPDFAFIAEHYHHQRGESHKLFQYLMGGQRDENDYHRSVYDEPTLRALMLFAGLDGIKHWESDCDDYAAFDASLNLEATKCLPRKPIELPKIMAVMSTAKLAFTENLFCAIKCFQPRNIDIIKHTGVFWGQCLERTMVDAIEQGAEWILTLDYDTVFTGEQLDALCYLLATNLQADAIAPWQMKRECDYPLAYFTTPGGACRERIPMETFDGDLTQVDTAHFGLTLLRASSFKKMAHPWFLAEPNKSGEWGEARIDEDIAFWKKWKAAGNTLYLANHVPIGHLQQLATWPDQNFRTIHQYVTDFYKEGAPKRARR